ncbi:MAG: hypothetical protein NT154_40500 [Verrucomicrobia bacterium]|nr:hypothetical protein [Verrucomicrobiota bacterium]
MRKTAGPVVRKGAGAQSPKPDPFGSYRFRDVGRVTMHRPLPPARHFSLPCTRRWSSAPGMGTLYYGD